MARPKIADRSKVADQNITFRASQRTRYLLDKLVARAGEKAAAVGGSASIGSYLSSLIEREAQAEGIAAPTEAELPAASPPKAAAPTKEGSKKKK